MIGALKGSLLLLLSIALGACSGNFEPVALSVSSGFGEDIGCHKTMDVVWKTLYALAEEDLQWINEEADENFLIEKLQQTITEQHQQLAPQIDYHDLADNYLQVLKLVNTKMIEANLQTKQQRLKFLVRTELGSEDSWFSFDEEQQFSQWLKAIDDTVSPLKQDCEPKQPPTADGPDQLDDLKLKINPAAYGGKKLFATAYQNCEVANSPSLNSSHAVKGIKITGKHSNGVGNVRVISSLTSFLKNHAYYPGSGRDPASTPSCRTPGEFPMIYDYGGKPGATSKITSALDLFRNAGTGSKELGIDCSGFVFSSLASAGLKLHPDKTMKAVGVFGVNARMLKDPERNGLLCLEKFKLTSNDSLQAGDIISTTGHTVLVERVGEDPFGLNQAKTKSDCSNLSARNFDFTLLQSGPSNGGVGIHRVEAKTYLARGSMGSRLKTIAVSLCKAKFSASNKPVNSFISNLSIVRHNLEAGCISQEIPLTGESCVHSCEIDTYL